MENVFEVHKKSFGEGNGTLVPFPFKTQPKKLALKKIPCPWTFSCHQFLPVLYL